MELKSGFVDLQKVLKSHLESYQTVAASKDPSCAASGQSASS